MTALATDAFTRANETPLASPWTKVTSEGNLNLTSNQVVQASGDADAAWWYDGGVTWPNDQYSQAAISTTSTFSAGDGPGLALRCSNSARTYYRLIANHAGSNNIELGKKVAGTYTAIWDRTAAYTDGQTIYIEAQGTTIIVKVNGSAVGASSTDSSIASGRPGLAYSGEDAGDAGAMDTWEGGDFAGAGGTTRMLATLGVGV